jgi:tyrosine-protein phosphatase SIW14
MKKDLGLIILFSLTVFYLGYAQKKVDQSGIQGKPAEKMDVKGFHNLYKVNEDLFRSEQPDERGMKELQKIGIRTIVDLRNFQNDQKEARDTKLILLHIPIKAGKISYSDILISLKSIHYAVKPVLVHCQHGSDRTGCIVAAYRMVYENWSKDEAINEFLEKDYGYHTTWYPNILSLLRSLDIELLKSDLGEQK